MNASLEKLEPKTLWKHFFALCAIPRGSKNEKAVAAHVVAEAKRMGLPVRQDAAGNVIVTKPATKGREGAKPTILQGHLDMVCEKNESKKHDFTKDPITLIQDGDWLKADGTTLGADNGIGCAAALAVMEAKDLSHGPLEFLFTIDEETGLTGAFNLEPGSLKGRQLLNLDTEEEGAVYIGCAGGMDSVATRKVKRVGSGAGKSAFRLKVAGLKGGHSGLDINTGRGNALKILARALRSLGTDYALEVSALDGGSKRNAIPREAFATIYMDPGKLEAFKGELVKLQTALRAELGKADPEVVLSVESAQGSGQVFEAEEAKRVVSFLYASLHGMLAMTPDIPDLVQTSTNLAIIETKDDVVTVSMSHRSSIDSAKKDVGAMIKAYCELAGFEVTQGSGYPGWAPNVHSPVLAIAKQVHAQLFGKEPHIKAVHAGLECGIIGEKFPGMDTISMGPTIQGAHSPDEKVGISSTATFWKYLVALLEKV
ncbi:MAG: aminoacyl-histidine dipeptidase [Deltaproteobacteria bacterium]|nr:aminoacyl-histidine dipeptidase [Deltaproteobacteria bacterium]